MNEDKPHPSGWYLPSDDNYFHRFLDGAPPKRNGFNRENLLEALRYVDNWDCAIDVGAHVGFWAFDMAQRFALVRAFEPDPATYQCLIKNLNEFDNVIFYNCAVGNKAGACQMRTDAQRPGNTGSHYVLVGSGQIAMITLDEMQIPTCGFLKIDVEGFELRVLEGARGLIKRCRPVISMETSDYKWPDRYPDIPQDAAKRWLLKRGYREMWYHKPDTVFVPS